MKTREQLASILHDLRETDLYLQQIWYESDCTSPYFLDLHTVMKLLELSIETLQDTIYATQD